MESSSVGEVFLWGLLATGVLTTSLRVCQALRLTRIDIPFLLGTLFTPDRDRAKAWGFVVHFLNGWWLAFLYWAFFRAFGASGPWLGALMGSGHAAFVLVVVVPLLPAVHPRMASESSGPEPTRLLEPPGFLALHYGYRTPVVTVAAHLLYGGILGAFLR